MLVRTDNNSGLPPRAFPSESAEQNWSISTQKNPDSSRNSALDPLYSSPNFRESTFTVYDGESLFGPTLVTILVEQINARIFMFTELSDFLSIEEDKSMKF